MTNLKFIFVFAVVLIIISSCATPEKALRNQNYNKAMRLATKKILKGQNIDENRHYLNSAAQEITASTLGSQSQRYDNGIDDWKIDQVNYNKALTTIGKHNIATKGMVADSYNQLCDAKYDLDLKIVNYYYEEGVSLLTEAELTGETASARNAYSEFIKSEEVGGHAFYHDIETYKERCVEQGMIYVTAPADVGLLNIFVTRIPDEDMNDADCIISIDYGFPQITESSSITTNQLKKSVKTGQNTVTDTSGVVTFEDIYEDVFATEQIEEIQFEGSQWIQINVNKKTSECFLESNSRSLSVSDKCTTKTYTGDSRAIGSNTNTTCDKAHIRNCLQNDLRSRVNSCLDIR